MKLDEIKPLSKEEIEKYRATAVEFMDIVVLRLIATIDEINSLREIENNHRFEK